MNTYDINKNVKDVVTPIQKKTVEVPAILKAARHGELEKFKEIYQSEDINEDIMAKGVVIACRFGHLHVIKYAVGELQGKIFKGYLDTASKYRQRNVYFWLQHEILKRKSEKKIRLSWEQLCDREFYSEEYGNMYFDIALQKGFEEQYDDFSKKWDQILEKEEKEREQQKIREKERELWLENWMKERTQRGK